MHKDGFWLVLESVCSTRIYDTSPNELAKTATCLNKSALLVDNPRREEIEPIKKSLLEAAKLKPDWGRLNDDIAQGISALLIIQEDFFSVNIFSHFIVQINSHPYYGEPCPLSNAPSSLSKSCRRFSKFL